MATRTWIGATDDSTLGANWSGAAAPTSADAAVFDGTALGPCTLGADLEFASINLTGWTQLLQCANKKLKLFGGTLTIPDPTKVENCSEITITGGGNLVCEGGTTFGFFADNVILNLVSGTLTASANTWQMGFSAINGSGGTIDFTSLPADPAVGILCLSTAATLSGVTMTNLGGKILYGVNNITLTNCTVSQASTWNLFLDAVGLAVTATGTTISKCHATGSSSPDFRAASNVDGGGNTGFTGSIGDQFRMMI